MPDSPLGTPVRDEPIVFRGDALAGQVEERLVVIERQLQEIAGDVAKLRMMGRDAVILEDAVTGALESLRSRQEDDDEPRTPAVVVSEPYSSPMRSALRRRLANTRTDPMRLGSGDADGRAATVTLGAVKPKTIETLVGFCNPLLDMSLRVDAQFLKRYELTPDGWAAATDETLEIFSMLSDNPATQYIPGGSGLNTLRVAQWVTDVPGATCFLGTTARDRFGKKLHDATESEGVRFPKIELDAAATGTCAVLLNGDHRSLVANLGAGGVFRANWLKERSDLQGIIQKAGLYYVTGFFLRTSPETVADLAALASVRNRELALNMSAAFVCTCSVDLFKDILPRVDLLFGNKDEAKALAEALGDHLPSCDRESLLPKDYAWILQQRPKFGNPRIVVITQGPGSVVVASQTGVESYDTAPLPQEAVVDTNGAGDAFAGGFLAKRLQGGNIAECVRIGQWAAATIIGQPGVTLPHINTVPLPQTPGRRRQSVVSISEPGPSRMTIHRPSLGSPSLKGFDLSRMSLGDSNPRLRASAMLSTPSRGDSPPAGRSLTPAEQVRLVGLCNPLLDITLRVDEDFLKKYGLTPDGWAAATETTMPVFEEMAQNPSSQYGPGGSGLNTLRVAQWILDTSGSATFVGTTGKDKFGERLHQATEKEGVAFPRIEVSDLPTGTCAVLLTDDCRSLVANLGASNVFEPDWFQSNAEVKAAVDAATAFYVTGFFLRTAPESVEALAQLAAQYDKELCLNLSAPFVCEGAVQHFRDILPSVSLLFGNTAEAFALVRALGHDPTDVSAVARRLQQMPKTDPSRPRLVIVTQGAGPVVVAKEDGTVTYETRRLPGDQVIDTNGAGDAFAGGFLAKRLQGGSVAECVRVGQWAATIIIGQPGCTLPPLPPGQMPGYFADDCISPDKAKAKGMVRPLTRLGSGVEDSVLTPGSGSRASGRRPSMGIVALKLVGQFSPPKATQNWGKLRNAVSITSRFKAKGLLTRKSSEPGLDEGTEEPK
eukprot:Hpha_TRINITY_DN14675_c3_g1::TRINITY_DN14675_c3_g1_i1::g.48223::m.48223/K00856/E2.7.1.20, ADK; adenosine kinase